MTDLQHMLAGYTSYL